MPLPRSDSPALMSRRQWNTLIPALAAMGLSPAQAQAAFPSPDKSVKLLVPYAAGGGTDAMARAIAPHLQKAFGSTVMVDNRPGAGGLVGTEAVAKGQKDGHQALVTITSLIQAPSIFAKVPFDPLNDFIPVALLARVPLLIAVPGNSPYKSVQELVQGIQRDPKAHSMGNYGNGTLSHVQGAMFDKQAGLNLPMVAYKGSAPMAADLAAGHVHLAFIDMSSLPLERAGRIRYLAACGLKRLPSHPDVPTLTELGYKDFDMLGFAALFLPAGTPAAVVAAYDQAAQAGMQTPEFKKQQSGLEYLPGDMSMAQFQAMVKRDAEVWAKLIKSVGIEPS